MLVAQLLLGCTDEAQAALAALQARHSHTISMQQQPAWEGHSQCQVQQQQEQHSPLPVAAAAAEHCTDTAALPAGMQQQQQHPAGESHGQGQQQQHHLSAAAAVEHFTDTSGLAASIQQLHAAWGDSTPEACIQLLQYCLHNIQSSSNSDMLQSPDLNATYLYCAERL